MNEHSEVQYDVAIVGGGPAGLSAAVALGRSLRSVIVIDGGQPRNAASPAAHNVLGREGMSPLELLRQGRAEAASYGVEFVDDVVVAATRTVNARGDDSDDPSFFVTLGSGRQVTARRLVLATGLTDELPDIEGLAACWGHTALHCPYCHGYEVRGQRLAVLATSPMSLHHAELFAQLSDHVTLVTHALELTAAQRQRLNVAGVSVVDDEVAAVRSEGTQARAVVLTSGAELDVDAVVVAPRFVVNGDLYESLGGELVEHPMGMGRLVPTDARGGTPVRGVWAAGNVVDLAGMVAGSSGAGVLAGVAINADLITTDLNRAS